LQKLVANNIFSSSATFNSKLQINNANSLLISKIQALCDGLFGTQFG
jgi:hypothetical protein